MQKQTSIVLMNFSGIYREEEFWKNRQVSWIEVQDICEQTAIVMMKQSQRSIKEQKAIRLPESTLSIPAIITI